MADNMPSRQDGVGLLNEKPLHAALKAWYARPGDRTEVPVDGSFIDLVRDDLLIEIQTRGFSALKRKLERLVPGHPVRLVYPVAYEKWILRLAGDGVTLCGAPKIPQARVRARSVPGVGQFSTPDRASQLLPGGAVDPGRRGSPFRSPH